MNENKTTFSKILVLIGFIYLGIGVMGLLSLKLRFLLPFYIILLVFLAIWQILVLVVVLFWESRLRDLVEKLEDTGSSSPALTAYDFLQKHSLLTKILLGIMAASSVTAVFTTRSYMLKRTEVGVMYA